MVGQSSWLSRKSLFVAHLVLGEETLMEDKRPRKIREPKTPPGKYVIFLTHRRRIGAPLYLVAARRKRKTSFLKYAMRFETKAQAQRYARLYDHPDYRCSVEIYTEEKPRPTKKPSGTRQKLLRYMED